MSESRDEYVRRMHRVVEHIDRNLDQPLDVASLAQVAHFSPFHFHRLFGAWMGETVGEYLRRRRIEVAAQRLVAQPRLPLLQVALAVGFGSSEAFAHAFKARFGMSASAFRREFRKADQVVRKIDQARGGDGGNDGVPFNAPERPLMNVTLIDREPRRIACLRYTGPYGPAVNVFWQQRVYPWLVAHELLAAPRYGLSHDDPDITAPDKCRYDAAVEVSEDFVPSGGAVITALPGGRYASVPFKGTGAEIAVAWQSLLRDWLPASRLQLDARPCFEYYPPEAEYDEATGAFECHLVIPVAPL